MSEYKFKWTLGTTCLVCVFLFVEFVWLGIPVLTMLEEWIHDPANTSAVEDDRAIVLPDSTGIEVVR